jgi:hypothetical protein
VFSFITSNKWYRSAYGTKLREWLNKNTRVLQLIDFGDAPVFTAISYPTIVILQRVGEADSASLHQVRAFNWKPGPPVEAFGDVVERDSFTIPQSSLRSDGWQLESPGVLQLLDKLRRAGKPLGEYVNGRFYRGVTTGLNDAFIVDTEQRERLIAEDETSTEVLKPFLRGRDVKRWSVEPSGLWLIFTRRGIDIKRYPAILQHLRKYEKRLTPGIQGGRKPGQYKWYEIQDSTEYWKEFEKPKIIYPDIAQGSEFACDREKYFLGNTLYLLPTEENWLLGLLNSKLVFWFYTKVSSQIRGGFVRFIAEYVAQIPVPSQTNLKGIEVIVGQILRAKKDDPSADLSNLEPEIDERVYRLYGLTKDEIRLVEESTSR